MRLRRLYSNRSIALRTEANFCPICSNRADLQCSLSSEYLRLSLSRYFSNAVPDNVHISNYQLLTCAKCALQYAWPMEAGHTSFYDWITRTINYYPRERWEWGEVRRWLVQQNRPIRLLEVGCGSGDFLELLKDLEHVSSIGLDTTEGSLVSCRSKGLEVYAQTLERYQMLESERLNKFDVVVAFHCLEHVPDPKGLIASMLNSLTPNGQIFISTPYSPMSFEANWFDPLNNPPHHLTRWNQRSYTELAKQLGLHLKLRLPQSAPLVDRVAESLNLEINGPQHMQTKKQIFVKAAKRPYKLIHELFQQIVREKVNGATAANVVLVELGQKPSENPA